MTNSKKIIGNVLILCEGKTEEKYLRDLLRTFPIFKKCNFKSGKKNSYKNFQYLLEKSRKIYDAFIIIMDLDRATADQKELQHLENLITLIRKGKNKSHVFLTYLNFEDWLKHHFKPALKKEKLLERLGFRNLDELKSKENLYQIIQKNNGKIENAENYFKNQPLYCSRDLKTYSEHIRSIQSNLFYFRDYMKGLY